MNVKIHSPSLPYWNTIPGGLTPGKVIELKGSFPVSMDRSSYSQINLCAGGKENILLHLSIRFNHREVVRNSCRNGSWEREEKGQPFPFECGSQFWIQIMVQQDAYHISVNGQYCWTFAHRMPAANATVLNIEGPLNVFEIDFTDQSSMYRPGVCQPAHPMYPFPGTSVPTAPVVGYPGTCPPPVQPGFGSYQQKPLMPCLPPIENPPIPLSHIISGGIKPGLMIYISGQPRANYERFTINLQCGNLTYPPADIAFHFDVRAFTASVVRNTFRNNQWDTEEVQAPNFPFPPSVPFDMIILVQNDKYMVAVNGQHFISFPHRITRFALINTLKIEHDISVSAVRFAN